MLACSKVINRVPSLDDRKREAFTRLKVGHQSNIPVSKQNAKNTMLERVSKEEDHFANDATVILDYNSDDGCGSDTDEWRESVFKKKPFVLPQGLPTGGDLCNEILNQDSEIVDARHIIQGFTSRLPGYFSNKV